MPCASSFRFVIGVSSRLLVGAPGNSVRSNPARRMELGDLRLNVGGVTLDGDTVMVNSPGRESASSAGSASPSAPLPARGGQPAPGGGAPKAPALQPREYSADEHLLSLEELRARFGTQLDLASPADSAGLSPAAVAAARAAHGANQLTPPRERSELAKFLLQFTDGFMLLLMVAGGLCFLAQVRAPLSPLPPPPPAARLKSRARPGRRLTPRAAPPPPTPLLPPARRPSPRPRTSPTPSSAARSLWWCSSPA